MNEVDACRSVLIEVLTVLAKDLDKLAVVGGWVPELAFPNKGHIGSLDVDLALDARKLEPKAYESIRNKLADAGYQQSVEMSNRFFRNIPGTSIQVKVDLITGGVSRNSRRRHASPHSRTDRVESPWSGFGVYLPTGCCRRRHASQRRSQQSHGENADHCRLPLHQGNYA